MPAKPSWFLRVPEILEELGAAGSLPLLDRSTVERLFRVRRRRAHQLMARFGGFQAGRTFLVSRSQLMEWLEVIRRGEDFTFEERRKQRLVDTLEEARKQAAARQVRIAAPDDVWERNLADLPEGIGLRPGELRIEFAGAEELLRKLLELSQAIMNDYARFQSLVETGPGAISTPGGG